MDTNIMLKSNLEQLKELKEYILPLNKEEFSQLERNILDQGCREALVVWKKKDGRLVIVDGHNRYKICKKHEIPFDLKQVEFDNIENVKEWMINNQLGRRNLNPDQMSYYRGMKYENLKRKKGGYEKVQLKGKSSLSAYEVLANEFKVSQKTIQRDAKYSRALNLIGQSNINLKNAILRGDVKLKKSDITLFSDVDEEKKWTFKNEADLYNKASIIKNNMLSKIEEDLRDSRIAEEEKVKKAQQELIDIDDLFPDHEERIKRIKGEILSSINKAIQERDIEVLDKLRGLIDRLKAVLLGE
ncbi:MAG: hypothetical protein ACJA2S_000950 [Cyclobacteriaceae bacterium]|jgi:hypothetical protein